MQLHRKAEPAIDLTPFLITGLARDVRLDDLLLERGEMDSAPEMSELRNQVRSRRGAGGRLHRQSYFFALF
jgi:chromosome partition protein MukB